MTNTFDFNQAIEKLKSGKGLLGEDDILTPLISNFSISQGKNKKIKQIQYVSKSKNIYKYRTIMIFN